MQASTTARGAQKQATRQTIKQAARRCFTAQGWTATGIADIVRAAGVAQGTFYVHFASKDAVLDELMADFNTEFAARLGPVFTAASSRAMAATVQATAETFLDHWQQHRAFVEACAHRSAGGLALTSMRDGVNPPMAALLRGALAAAAAELGASSHNLELLAHALLAMWLRVGLQYLFNPEVSRQDAIHVLVASSVGAVGAVLSGPATQGGTDA